MSYGLYIGKNLTADGHAWLAGYGDEPSSHWLEIIPKKKHNIGKKINTGVISNVYLLHVYAINTEVSIGPSATRKDLLGVIDGHIIAGGFLSTKYLSSTIIRKG